MVNEILVNKKGDGYIFRDFEGILLIDFKDRNTTKNGKYYAA